MLPKGSQWFSHQIELRALVSSNSGRKIETRTTEHCHNGNIADTICNDSAFMINTICKDTIV